MITVQAAGGPGQPVRLRLRPNPPLPRRRQNLFLSVLGGLMGGYAVLFVALGFWPVLPFAGLEFIAVVAALSITARRGKRCETVRVTAARVIIQRSDGRAEPMELPSAWARVRLAPGRQPWYPSRLLLGVHGRWLEVGRFLTESERHTAAHELRRALAPYSAWSDARS